MTTLANQRPYTLARDGDSRERRWADEIRADFGSYERFWRAHVVPLTFRIRDRENYYLRPSVSKQLLNLADAAYATFFHLTECHAWAHRMNKILKDLEAKDPAAWSIENKTEIVPTEALYCFFSDAFSMLDSSVCFGEAVNEIIAKYMDRGATVFRTTSNGSKRLESWNEPQSEKAYQELIRTVTGYRNALVHRKPVFVLTRRMPQQAYIDRWSGLTAITRAVQDQNGFFSQSEWVSERLDCLLTKMRIAMEGVWAAAAAALEPLLARKKYCDHQRRPSREDEKLTLEEIKKFLRLTRIGRRGLDRHA